MKNDHRLWAVTLFAQAMTTFRVLPIYGHRSVINAVSVTVTSDCNEWLIFYLVEHELWRLKPVSPENIVQSFCFGCELLTFCINTVPNLWIGFGFTSLMFQFIGFTFNSAEIHKTNLFFFFFFPLSSTSALHAMTHIITDLFSTQMEIVAQLLWFFLTKSCNEKVVN